MKIPFLPATFGVLTLLIGNFAKGADENLEDKKLTELGQPHPTLSQEIEQPDSEFFSKLSITGENGESKVADSEDQETLYTQHNQGAIDYFSTLPIETVYHIFDYIPLSILYHKQIVSKSFKDMINEYIGTKKSHLLAHPLAHPLDTFYLKIISIKINDEKLAVAYDCLERGLVLLGSNDIERGYLLMRSAAQQNIFKAHKKTFSFFWNLDFFSLSKDNQDIIFKDLWYSWVSLEKTLRALRRLPKSSNPILPQEKINYLLAKYGIHFVETHDAAFKKIKKLARKGNAKAWYQLYHYERHNQRFNLSEAARLGHAKAQFELSNKIKTDLDSDIKRFPIDSWQIQDAVRDIMINLAKSAAQGYPKSLAKVCDMFTRTSSMEDAKNLASQFAEHGYLKPLSIVTEAIEKGEDFYKTNSLHELLARIDP